MPFLKLLSLSFSFHSLFSFTLMRSSINRRNKIQSVRTYNISFAVKSNFFGRYSCSLRIESLLQKRLSVKNMIRCILTLWIVIINDHVCVESVKLSLRHTLSLSASLSLSPSHTLSLSPSHSLSISLTLSLPFAQVIPWIFWLLP